MAPTKTPAANRARVCEACGWTSCPKPTPNGRYSVEWAIPENSENCGEPPLTKLSDGDFSGVREERRRAEVVRVHFGELSTGLLQTVGTRRIPYGPPTVQRHPDWDALARAVYRT